VELRDRLVALDLSALEAQLRLWECQQNEASATLTVVVARLRNWQRALQMQEPLKRAAWVQLGDDLPTLIHTLHALRQQRGGYVNTQVHERDAYLRLGQASCAQGPSSSQHMV